LKINDVYTESTISKGEQTFIVTDIKEEVKDGVTIQVITSAQVGDSE